MTNIQQLIKENHIKLQDQDIDEDLPFDAQSPEKTRNHDEKFSQGDEIKDETE
jgi:hypothetical protein